jgi:hypothetical protein
MIKRYLTGGTLMFTIACSNGTPPPSPPAASEAPAAPAPPAPPVDPPAPWAGAPLSWSAVPPAFRSAWEAAENRDSCRALAPGQTPSPSGAPRTASFAGGWAVAYDLPETRSAYGVAGTGASALGPTYDDFPDTLRWSDGSVARYGPEGGTGPNQLAYLTIPGQACLYNIWSAISVEHLEALLTSLRFVRPGS